MDSRSDPFSSFLSQVNDKPVFNMTHDECCREIKNSGQALRLECERSGHESFTIIDLDSLGEIT